jgi:hypothetical protein
MSCLYKLFNFYHKWMKYKIIMIVPCLLQPVLSYCHPSSSRGVLCFQWRGSGNCFVCWYSCSGLRCINFFHSDYCIQISYQRYISAVIHKALLNNVRKVGRLVLSRTSCLLSHILTFIKGVKHSSYTDTVGLCMFIAKYLLYGTSYIPCP